MKTVHFYCITTQTPSVFKESRPKRNKIRSKRNFCWEISGRNNSESFSLKIVPRQATIKLKSRSSCGFFEDFSWSNRARDEVEYALYEKDCHQDCLKETKPRSECKCKSNSRNASSQRLCCAYFIRMQTFSNVRPFFVIAPQQARQSSKSGKSIRTFA